MHVAKSQISQGTGPPIYIITSGLFRDVDASTRLDISL